MFDPDSPAWLLLPFAAIYVGLKLRLPRRA
jgi:hypothetical protein